MPTYQPVRYAIDITPDMDRFEFKGQVTIEFQAQSPIDTITLNVLELAIWQCRKHDGQRWIDLPFAVDPQKETLTIQLGEAHTGRIDLQINYQGIINDKMAGFYRSQATYDNTTYQLAVTQFQESSARQAFPCMDHPLHKAFFDVTMTVPKNLTAIGNTLPVKEESLDDQRKKIVFGATPKMSTYLLFFGLGPFELVTDNEDQRVRLAHLPGLAHTTELGLSFGRKALAYCEQYYDIAYPLPKMDLIAVPDFAFGAMENWGAITFRENLLLDFPGLTSKAGIQRICEVTAHEIAHQWFGNLVTPADWKFLWLNESFATYFGFGVVAHYHPDWGIWEQFLQTETATALVRDGLRDTIAIEIPGGEHVVINSSTAPIIYNKGGSILRMVEGFIGSESYQKGVRSYLSEHQYDCAESHHLWQAFEKAADKPITAMMQSWIGQAGHPMVTVHRQGDTLSLSQQRFTYLPADTDQKWDVPLTMTAWSEDDRPQPMSLLMTDASANIDLPPGTRAYKINNAQTGFYRVSYQDKDNLAALGELIEKQQMGSEDRWGVQNDLYAFVRQGTFALDEYLAFLTHYASETAYLPLSSIAGHLFQATLTAPQGRQDAIASAGRSLAGQVLDRIGTTPQPGEPQTTSILRDQLLWQATVWGLDTIADFAAEQFDQLTAGKPVHADIAKAVMQIGARTRGKEALTFLCRRFDETPSEHERMNILAALGALPSWELTREALAFTLEKVPPRNRFIPIVATAANPAVQDRLWEWYQTNLEDLEKFHPLLYERVITAILPYGGIEREEQVQRFAEQYVKDHPGLKDAVALALEHLQINTRMRKQ